MLFKTLHPPPLSLSVKYNFYSVPLLFDVFLWVYSNSTGYRKVLHFKTNILSLFSYFLFIQKVSTSSPLILSTTTKKNITTKNKLYIGKFFGTFSTLLPRLSTKFIQRIITQINFSLYLICDNAGCFPLLTSALIKCNREQKKYYQIYPCHFLWLFCSSSSPPPQFIMHTIF